MSFVDECNILLKAGNGGNGIVAWRREAHVPLGGPSGGNGGNGGNIILVGDHNENSLQNLRFLKKVVANNGENGQIKNMHGKNGEDVRIKVPVGTMVYNKKDKQLICDIKQHGQEVVVCYGGLGGHGNFHFKSGFNKAPSLYELGDLGESKECHLVLKHLADVGIIGLPNAGKSTFISKISNAKPKIGNYQFTTLNPILGIVNYQNKKIVFADIPGLIEGASQGLGLGHNFLKHIERTKLLIHLISMDEIDNSDPVKSYETIKKELANYSQDLLKKKTIIVANKMDVASAKKNLAKLKQYLKEEDIIEVSTLNNQNLDAVISRTYQLLNVDDIEQQSLEPSKVITLKKDHSDELSRKLLITKLNKDTWDVKCDFLKYWAHRIPLTTKDNIVRFNQKMKTVDVEETLKQMGANKGDTIIIYEAELVFED